MKYLGERFYFNAGGLVNRIGRDIVLTAKPQMPKIRIETHHWIGPEAIKIAKGKNFKIKPLDRDVLVKRCQTLLNGEKSVKLNDDDIYELVAKTGSLTGIEIGTQETKKPENVLKFYNDPNGSGFYELNVAGFSERTSIIIPKKRHDSAAAPIEDAEEFLKQKK